MSQRPEHRAPVGVSHEMDLQAGVADQGDQPVRIQQPGELLVERGDPVGQIAPPHQHVRVAGAGQDPAGRPFAVSNVTRCVIASTAPAAVRRAS